MKAPTTIPQAHESRPDHDLSGSVLRRFVPFPGAGDPKLENTPELHEITFIVNHGSGPVELFIHGAPAPYQSLANAVGRLASAALQCGTPPERIVKTLRGLSDGDWGVRWSEGVVVRSLPDALARVIEEWDPDAWKPVKESEDS